MLTIYNKCKHSQDLKKSKKCKHLNLSKKIVSKKGLSNKSRLQSKIETKLDIDKLIINRLKSDLHDEIETLEELIV